MELKEAFIQSMKEALLWYKISSDYAGESEKNSLFLSEQVNILISFSESIKGNVIFGLARPTALRIATVINGRQTNVLDDQIQGELGEVTKFVVELAIGKSQIVNSVSLSPPMVITGNNVFSMISRMKTTQLNFSLNSESVHISYYIEGGRHSLSRH